MFRCAAPAVVVSMWVVFLVPPAASAAEISGALLYDDLPVATVFPDITATVVYANPWDTGDQIYGTVDLDTSTYSISGLVEGRWGISVFLDRTPPASDVGNSGDLQSYVNIDVNGPQDVVEQDLDIRYNYHVLSPVDSELPLDGAGLDCTSHPIVDYPITFTIDPVPRAVDYWFNVALRACPGGNVGWIDFHSAEPSGVIEWGSAGEDFQQPYLRCQGATGKDLCGGPTFHYTDANVWGLFLRGGVAGGRGIHRSDAVVIPAVASASGAQGTFWTSAVTVVNLSEVERDLEVLYTPRGGNGLDSYASTTVTVAPRSQLSWPDVMDGLFATTGAGALEIRGGQLAVTSRTSTPGGDGGSYGQGIPPVQPGQLLSVAGTDDATMGGVEQGTIFRTNLGLCEVWGESATVRVTILDADGAELGHRDVQLRPYENTQINEVAKTVANADPLAGGMARVAVTAGGGRVAAYLSVVDNTTGDPTFIAVAPQTPGGGQAR